jgi:hypothetical protein
MKIDLTPRPSALIESLRSIGYSLNTALADIIDNSVTAGSSKISVRFEWNKKNSWIAVIDDGIGMSKEGLIEAMRFGSKSPTETRHSDDLGRFGLGLKTASISQCRILTVVTIQKNKVNGCTLDLENMDNSWSGQFLSKSAISRDKLLQSLISNLEKNKQSGTIVLWRNLDALIETFLDPKSESAFSAAMADARKHIETVFHRFIKSEKNQNSLTIDFNDSELFPFDPFGAKSLAKQELPPEKINIEGHNIIVQPFVLPHQSKVSNTVYQKNAGSEGYLENQGFYVYRNKRLIVKSTWFRLIKKEELNKLLRIRIDIPNALDHLWKIDVKKSTATPPQEVLINLKRIIGKVEHSGQRVFKKRATNIQAKKTVPFWIRTANESRIKYVVNSEHPILGSIFSEIKDDSTAKLKAYLRILGDAFPKDLYYADLADDETEIDDKPNADDINEAILNLVNSLSKSGLENEVIKEKLLEMDLPGITSHRILEVLKNQKLTSSS